MEEQIGQWLKRIEEIDDISYEVYREAKAKYRETGNKVYKDIAKMVYEINAISEDLISEYNKFPF